jgi:predicted metal-dependent phosphoesterase TrpH
MLRDYCDLHTHTNCSDGTLTPTQLVAEAEALGLGAIALCDHNTVAGLPEFLAAGASTRVRTVSGVEFSTDYGDTELHILALFVRPEHYAPINDLVADAVERKEASNLDLARKLREAGYAIDYDRICASTNGTPNRANFGRELVELGYCGSVKEAIHTLLSPKNGLYTPPKHPDSLEVIRFIRELGAVPVLAHPFLNMKEPALRAFLPHAVSSGLQAMETLYSDFTPELTQRAIALAEEFGLKQSGGSDYHGSAKPDIALGTGRGSLRIPISVLRELENP